MDWLGLRTEPFQPSKALVGREDEVERGRGRREENKKAWAHRHRDHESPHEHPLQVKV